eukprot:Nk52_evm1s2656 gene=Nk52_evmTU1s2656
MAIGQSLFQYLRRQSKTKIAPSAYLLRNQLNENFHVPNLCNLVYLVCQGITPFNQDTWEYITELRAEINTSDDNGMAPLHLVGNLCSDVFPFAQPLARLLLELGGELEQRDRYGRTPLHYAVAKDHRKMVLFFLQEGADFYAETDEGQTVLHTAARYDSVKLITGLVEYFQQMENEEAEIQSIDSTWLARNNTLNNNINNNSNANNPLTSTNNKFAIGQDSIVYSEEFCQFRDKVDIKGRTALQIAALFDMTGAAEVLLKLGSNPAHRDVYGISCLIMMISRTPGVAKLALNKLMVLDKAARKRKFILSPLENLDESAIGDAQKEYAAMLSKSALKEIVTHNVLSLVTHPVIKRLLHRKWNAFGYRGQCIRMGVYFMFILTWTLGTLWAPGSTLSTYSDAGNGVWRLGIEVIGIIILVHYVWKEVWELNRARKAHVRWKKLRLAEIEEDMKYVPHDMTWPDYEFYRQQHRDVRLTIPLGEYFFDPWNYADWSSYILMTAATVLHVLNVVDGELAKRNDHVVMLSFALIVAWIKVLKFARAYETFGPFVVMLGKMSGDVVKFVFLYSVFLIPFTASFFMIFEETDVVGYKTFPDSMMSLFRMTVIDFDYGALETAQPQLAPLLVALWIFISGILFVNLFVAMMSTTFQIVYDNAKAVSYMQHAEAILGVEDDLPKRVKKIHIMELIRTASLENPEVEFYDDDEAEDEEDGIQSLRLEISADIKRVQEALEEGQKRQEQILDHLDQLHGSKDMHDRITNIERIHEKQLSANDTNRPNQPGAPAGKKPARSRSIFAAAAQKKAQNRKQANEGGDPRASRLNTLTDEQLTAHLCNIMQQMSPEGQPAEVAYAHPRASNHQFQGRQQLEDMPTTMPLYEQGRQSRSHSRSSSVGNGPTTAERGSAFRASLVGRLPRESLGRSPIERQLLSARAMSIERERSEATISRRNDSSVWDSLSSSLDDGPSNNKNNNDSYTEEYTNANLVPMTIIQSKDLAKMAKQEELENEPVQEVQVDIEDEEGPEDKEKDGPQLPASVQALLEDFTSESPDEDEKAKKKQEEKEDKEAKKKEAEDNAIKEEEDEKEKEKEKEAKQEPAKDQENENKPPNKRAIKAPYPPPSQPEEVQSPCTSLLGLPAEDETALDDEEARAKLDPIPKAPTEEYETVEMLAVPPAPPQSNPNQVHQNNFITPPPPPPPAPAPSGASPMVIVDPNTGQQISIDPLALLTQLQQHQSSSHPQVSPQQAPIRSAAAAAPLSMHIPRYHPSGGNNNPQNTPVTSSPLRPSPTQPSSRSGGGRLRRRRAAEMSSGMQTSSSSEGELDDDEDEYDDEGDGGRGRRGGGRGRRAGGGGGRRRGGGGKNAARIRLKKHSFG